MQERCVRLRVDVHQPDEGDGTGECGSNAGSRDDRARGSWLPALDPGEERDQKERSDVEEIPLLDPLRPVRGEDPDLDRQPEDERDRGGAERTQRTVEVPRIRDEHDQGCEGKDEE